MARKHSPEPNRESDDILITPTDGEPVRVSVADLLLGSRGAEVMAVIEPLMRGEIARISNDDGRSFTVCWLPRSSMRERRRRRRVMAVERAQEAARATPEPERGPAPRGTAARHEVRPADSAIAKG